MSSFMFDYTTFYNYYNDKTKLINDPTPSDIYYFLYPSGPRITNPIKSVNSDYYITISGGIRVYISQLVNGDILFTIPNEINSLFYADHYHFGLQIKDERTKLLIPSYKNVPTVFFHKTIQLPHPLSNGGKDTRHCWFRNGSYITDIKDIICTQETSSRMIGKFPFNFSKDIEFIQEIISRPFLGILNQGGGDKYTVKKLKELAKKNKIIGYYKMNKKNLIKILS